MGAPCGDGWIALGGVRSGAVMPPDVESRSVRRGRRRRLPAVGEPVTQDLRSGLRIVGEPLQDVPQIGKYIDAVSMTTRCH
jgi:hypothetical protein